LVWKIDAMAWQVVSFLEGTRRTLWKKGLIQMEYLQSFTAEKEVRDYAHI